MIGPKATYRMMEWEFHTPPEGTFDIDIEGAVKASADAGAESLLLYTQDTWGYAFYPTDAGVRHPGLRYDLFGRELEAAHRYGLSVSAYYCLQLNEQCVRAHPDWAWVNEKGESERVRWHFTCLDTPYREYVLAMIREIFTRYPVDGLFLDVFGQQFAYYSNGERGLFCYCRHTEEAWDKEHPGDPYRKGFATPAGWKARYKWQEKRTMVDLLDAVVPIVHGRPGALLSLNGGPEAFPSAVLERVDYVYNEPVTTVTGISLGAIMGRGWGAPGWQAGVFTQHGYVDTYPSSIPRVQADALILQNARTFFVGNAPVVGGLDGCGYSRRWFQVAREHWEDVRHVDGFLPGAEAVKSIAVLYSEPTREERHVQKRPQEFRQATGGALETMVYSGRPVESLPDRRLSREALEPFDLLVLPETEVLSSSHADIIRDWVSHGGILVASHRSGLLDELHKERPDFALSDVFGVHFAAEEGRYATGPFSTFLESSGHPLAHPLSQGSVALSGTFVQVKPTTAEEVMHYRLPVMAEDMANEAWFNWGPPPPGPENAGPAVTVNRFAKGRAIYIGVPVFRAMGTRAEFGGAGDRPFWIRAWLRELARQLVPSPVAEISPVPFTEYLHGTVFLGAGRRHLLVQALNTVELLGKGMLRASLRAEIRIDRSRLRVKSARGLWPTTEDLPVRAESATAVIDLPSVERYKAVRVDLED